MYSFPAHLIGPSKSGSSFPRKILCISLLVRLILITLPLCLLLQFLCVFRAPLVVLDVGGAVAGLAWSPYNSSVLVAVTDECRAYVFDLSVRVCTPMCVQAMAQRRSLTASCVTFSPFYPIIFIGGEK